MDRQSGESRQSEFFQAVYRRDQGTQTNTKSRHLYGEDAGRGDYGAKSVEQPENLAL